MTNRGGGARGQATVELALVLPLVLGVILFAVQVGLVVRDEIMVVNAAREAARAAAVEPDPMVARQAAERSGGLDPSRLQVEMTRHDQLVTVTVRYRAVTEVPLIGSLLGDIVLEEGTTMRLEIGQL